MHRWGLAHSRCAAPFPVSLTSHLASLPTGTCTEETAVSWARTREPQVLIPDSHFAVPSLVWPDRLKVTLILWVQVVSSWGRWNFLSHLVHSRCSGNEHGDAVSSALATSGH